MSEIVWILEMMFAVSHILFLILLKFFFFFPYVSDSSFHTHYKPLISSTFWSSLLLCFFLLCLILADENKLIKFLILQTIQCKDFCVVKQIIHISLYGVWYLMSLFWWNKIPKRIYKILQWIVNVCILFSMWYKTLYLTHIICNNSLMGRYLAWADINGFNYSLYAEIESHDTGLFFQT